MSAGAIETGENHIKQGRASCDFGNEIDQSMVKLDYKRERDEISTNCMGEIEARTNGNS
jgi:hypothetical protein